MKPSPSCPLRSADVNSRSFRQYSLLVYCCGSCDLHFRLAKGLKLKAVWVLSGLVGFGGNLIAMVQRMPGDRNREASPC